MTKKKAEKVAKNEVLVGEAAIKALNEAVEDYMPIVQTPENDGGLPLE
jgi:hypothetical protein